MQQLSRAWLARPGSLPPEVACAPLRDWPERVIQFGEGNFLRAFADWMIDLANEHGLFGGRVVVVPPTRRGRVEALNGQDCLYTVLLRGLREGRAVEEHRVITCVSRAIDAYHSWDELVRCFCQPEIRFVVSNTTEAGIVFVDEPYRPGQCPESFPAKVAALLHERFQASAGDPASGLVFLPCELIERNGDTLRETVLRHAVRRGLGRDFQSWVNDSCQFLNTLVDRIVTGFPRDEVPSLARALGYEDALLDVAEWFHLWAIEGPPRLAEDLPLHRAGLNVVWTSDLALYRTRKVRVLNGAHTASVLAAHGAGLDLVGEMMADPQFEAFVTRLVFDEIVPASSGDDAEWIAYAGAVLDRFRNPFVKHHLLSISLNSVSKWRVRILPSILDHTRRRGTLPPLLSFSLAALLAFYRGRRTPEGQLCGWRGGEPYPIRDEAPVLDAFEAAWAAFDHHRDARHLTASLLGNQALWGMDLTTVAGLVDCVSESLSSVLAGGIRPSLARLLP